METDKFFYSLMFIVAVAFLSLGFSLTYPLDSVSKVVNINMTNTFGSYGGITAIDDCLQVYNSYDSIPSAKLNYCKENKIPCNITVTKYLSYPDGKVTDVKIVSNPAVGCKL
jgi:hypothetical protein